MNYQYVIDVGYRSITGLIPCGDLPDLKHLFDKEAESVGASSRIERGVMIAEKADRSLSMRISPVRQNVPGQPYEESLKLMMNEAFS